MLYIYLYTGNDFISWIKFSTPPPWFIDFCTLFKHISVSSFLSNKSENFLPTEKKATKTSTCNQCYYTSLQARQNADVQTKTKLKPQWLSNTATKCYRLNLSFHQCNKTQRLRQRQRQRWCFHENHFQFEREKTHFCTGPKMRFKRSQTDTP